MARAALESLFRPEPLDALFRQTAHKQYQKELLFSRLVELMTSVVLRVNGSVHDAYRKRAARLSVGDQAVYDKLRGMEPAVSAALLADSAARVGPVIDALGARLAPWLPGYRVQVIDGNHLSATQRRLRVLRQTWAAPLPGTALAVYEQERDMVTRVFLTPDGHAQERSLLGDVRDGVQGGDLWIADRTFCTPGFLFGLARADAASVLRQHGKLPFRLPGERRACGRTWPRRRDAWPSEWTRPSIAKRGGGRRSRVCHATSIRTRGTFRPNAFWTTSVKNTLEALVL